MIGSRTFSFSWPQPRRRQNVHAQIPPKMLMKIAFTLGSSQNLKRILDLLLAGASAHIQKVRRTFRRVADDVIVAIATRRRSPCTQCCRPA